MPTYSCPTHPPTHRTCANAVTSSLVRLMGWPGLGTNALQTAAKAVSMLPREIISRPLTVLRGEKWIGDVVDPSPPLTTPSSSPSCMASSSQIAEPVALVEEEEGVVVVVMWVLLDEFDIAATVAVAAAAAAAAAF